MRKKPFDIPSIHESLAMDLVAGQITPEEAANELCRTNWTPYVDLERTQQLLAPYVAKYTLKDDMHDHTGQLA